MQPIHSSLESLTWNLGFYGGETFFYPLAWDRLALLIHIENDSSGILRSRGYNFLFKNVENFEIRQKFAEIG